MPKNRLRKATSMQLRKKYQFCDNLLEGAEDDRSIIFYAKSEFLQKRLRPNRFFAFFSDVDDANFKCISCEEREQNQQMFYDTVR